MALASREEEHSRFGELTAFLGSQYAPGAFDVPSQMKELREEFQRGGIDMEAACTHTGERGCWILGLYELSWWNLLIVKAGAGLYEEDFKRLTLKLLPENVDRLFDKNDMVAPVCLLQLLLKEHRCIQKLVMRDNDLQPVPSFWLAVMKMSLKALHGLRSLDLTFGGESDDTKRHFFDALAEVTTLKEFHFQSLRCDSDLEARSVCQIVKRNCGHLQSVCITLGETFEPPHINDFFDGLSECTHLTSVEVKNLEPAQSKLLAKFMIKNKRITALTVSECGGLKWISIIVKKNCTLSKLKLSSDCDEDACILARELTQNTVLEYLHCTDVFVSAEEASTLADMVKVNKTLREIYIDSDMAYLTTPIAHGRATELAEAISSNKTLRKMDLSGLVFEAHSAVLLIQALEQNSALSKLRVTVLPTSGDCDLSPVIEAIETTGTCDRLEVLWHKKWFPRAAPMLQASTFFAEIHISEHCEHEGVVLEKLFENLQGNRFVTLLSIKVRISDDAWCQVGSFLAASNTIHTLVFDGCPGSDLAMKKFSDGLARNSSVRHIKMTGMQSVPGFRDPLRLAIGRNSYITSVDVGIDSCLFVLDYIYLSTSIVQVNTDKTRRVMKRLGKMLQENLSQVNGAVRFVLNPTVDRMSVGLFHESQYSPEMFRRLQEATGESDTETTRRILCAANFVEDHFFVIVGVVKTSLVCNRVGGKVLHDLNYVCLRKIASFLRVYDVKPSDCASASDIPQPIF